MERCPHISGIPVYLLFVSFTANIFMTGRKQFARNVGPYNSLFNNATTTDGTRKKACVKCFI